MRKRLVQAVSTSTAPSDCADWLDLQQLARVEITSEDPAFAIEGAFTTDNTGPGWRAAEAGEQMIRLVFDEPQRIRRIWLQFVAAGEERTQQFVLRWSPDGTSFREIVRQQWNFSPTGATSEIEDYHVDLAGVAAFELKIIPNISGGDARACFAQLRLA